MVTAWLDLPSEIIVVTLILAFGSTAALFHWITFRVRSREFVRTFSGAVAPFFASPTIFAALMISFLASDVWVQGRQAAALVIEERDDVAAVVSLAHAIPSESAEIRELARNYVQSVVQDEWPMQARGESSPKTADALDALLHGVTATDVTQQAGSAIQAAMIDAVLRIGRARSDRLSLRDIEADDTKWVAVLLLALLAQAGVAVVHLERRRAQLLTLTITSCAVVVSLSLIAVCDRPFHGTRQMSPAPFQQLLSAPTLR